MRRRSNTALSFSEDQAMILASARDFCRNRSDPPSVRSLLHSAHALDHTGYDPAVWQEMVELGWPGVVIPERFGGSGLGLATSICIAEAMGRSLLATPFFSTILAAQALLRGANEEQQQAWLPKIADGCIGTLALLENEDWGDDAVTCTATEQDGQLLLSGSKQLVCDAGVAEFFVVSVNYQPLAGAAQTAFLTVTAGQLPSGAIAPQLLMDETKRASKVDFGGVTVARSALLEPARTASTLRDLKLLGALLCAAEATGSAAAALDCVTDYLRTRKQFGKPIGSYQALKHPSVEILTAMDSARSLIYHAATLLTNSALDTNAEIACRMAKAQATDALLYAGDRAVQFHGGMGFTYECDAQLYIRRAQWVRQHYGDALHHRKRLAPLLLDPV